MSNKKKSTNEKPEVVATLDVKVEPKTDNTAVAPESGAESVEASGKPDETASPEETITVQIGNHEVQVSKESDGEVSEEDKANAVDAEWMLDKISPYLESYPDEKEFHITSDGQVFLSKGKHDAESHQKFLKDGKELLSFVVEN